MQIICLLLLVYIARRLVNITGTPSECASQNNFYTIYFFRDAWTAAMKGRWVVLGGFKE